MAAHVEPVSLYRLCVVYVARTTDRFCSAHEDIYGSALPLNVCEDLVRESWKQQYFASLYRLLKYRSSPEELRYIEYRLPTSILSRLPKQVRESPDYLRKLVELTLVGVANEEDRRMVEVVGHQAHLRWVTRRQLDARQQAQIRVSENSTEIFKPMPPFAPPMDGTLYQLMTQQQLLESEMLFDQRITKWSVFNMLRGQLWKQMVKITCITDAQLPFLKYFQMNLSDFTACNLGRLLQSMQSREANNFPLVLTGQVYILPLGLHRVSNDRTLGVFSATLNISCLEHAELGLELSGTGLKTLASCLFYLYAAATSNESQVLRNLELKDLLTLIPPHQLSFMKDSPFKWVLRLKFSLNTLKGTKKGQYPQLRRNGFTLTEVLLQVCQLSDTFRGDRFLKLPHAP
ncbi:hypothetical protein MRX96_055593 [Rhipicephalus microplus]